AKTFSAGCAGIIALGESRTCIITDDDITPHLTVIKAVVNDDGGSAVASDWTMDITGANVSNTGFEGAENPGVTITLDAGGYSVGESSGPSGYTMALSSGCSGVVALGGVQTCIITNDDIALNVPTLTVVKKVVNDSGGSAVASDWTMNIAGANVSNTSFAGAEAGVTITLDAGAYSVGETGGPSGYAMSSSADCSGTIIAGDVLTCVITDDDIATNDPMVTVIVKVVNNHGGSAVPSDWTLEIVGSNVSNTGFAGSEAGATVALNPGQYVIVESGGPSGYAMSFSPDCSGAISLGDDLTCTITNDDIAPEITVITMVVNDSGGAAVASDWPTNISGTKVSNSGFDGAEAGVTVTLAAGIYSVSQGGGPSGYAKSFSGDCSGDIGLGGILTCTITNDDITPQLTLIKTVVNNGGGTAVASDWIMDIIGVNPSRTGFYGTGSPGLTISIDPGMYSVSERPGPSGYAMELSDDCSGVIALGDDLTCTITDDDIGPRLTVIVKVVNDNGSAVAGDWTMDIEGVNVSNTGFAGAEAGVAINLDPGKYNVGQRGGPSGYAMSFSFGCSGAIGLGDDLTCMITNNDIAPNVPTLTVMKKVVNDDGGSALASDWTMNITGADVSSTGFAGSQAGVTITLGIGEYSVSASGGPSGYVMTLSDDCSGAIELGGDLVCTITNNDDPAAIVPVTNASPTASIASPVDGTTIPADSSIDFIGSGGDDEDDILNGDSLVWSSSIEGDIGVGQSFTRSLAAGDHIITLTATDSQGASSSTVVALTISIAPTPEGNSGGGGDGLNPTPTPQPTPQPTATAAPTAAVAQPTPQPTVTAAPTATTGPPTPTATLDPVPTVTPEPTPLPVPTEVAQERATPIPAGALTPFDSDDGGGFSLGAMAGIGMGVIAVIAAVVVIDRGRKSRLSEAARSRSAWGRYRWGNERE
ncbi:MAG: hypothetical protein V3S68_06885, partial [Dehalococcoidia bacterium]